VSGTFFGVVVSFLSFCFWTSEEDFQFKKIKPWIKRGLPGLSTNYGGFDIAIIIYES